MTAHTLKEQMERFPIMPDKTTEANNFPIKTPQLRPDKSIVAS